ncbi:hypothetical protein RhiirA1_464820 [Rhizophagus irregularis]|uniref:Uncharacterized protein n=1 Tax=Rhizophagus irregularis TaxID=588596 RepID=A0A2I1ETM7_9GLOM|nr:hypothetical protein RhiirA1_464820 [Rhizophagus irregularis]PKY25460.1 hypothetical protein RhiirB3_440406 [Rhizophagus irregularis]GET50513.1 hypothetical protein GLOIN_2v1781566 [Rhizophagus irregularis DAOM 181602=DAOM 197198]
MTNGENIKRNFATTVKEKLCPRCEKFNEDWEHIWICEANEVENLEHPSMVLLEKERGITKKDLKKKKVRSREKTSGEELELEGKNNNLKQRKR